MNNVKNVEKVDNVDNVDKVEPGEIVANTLTKLARHLSLKGLGVPFFTLFTFSTSFTFLTFLTFLTYSPLRAEPYLAVREGKSCLACHVSPGGAGMRNAEGRRFSRTMSFGEGGGLALEDPRLGVGTVPLNFGVDLRAALEMDKRAVSFNTPQTTWYLHAPLTETVDVVYSAESWAVKEAYGAIQLDQQFAVRAGRFVLPFGLLVADPSALLTVGSGFGPSVTDTGAELDWSSRGPDGGLSFARAALTNGTGLASRIRAVTGQAGFHRGGVWVGGSLRFHQGDSGDQWRYGVFGGWRFSPLALVAEVDTGVDPAGNAMLVWHGDVEWSVATDWHLTLTHEYWDPNSTIATDERQRLAASARWFAMAFTEVVVSAAGVFRTGVDPAVTGQIQLHLFY